MPMPSDFPVTNTQLLIMSNDVFWRTDHLHYLERHNELSGGQAAELAALTRLSDHGETLTDDWCEHGVPLLRAASLKDDARPSDSVSLDFDGVEYLYIPPTTGP